MVSRVLLEMDHTSLSIYKKLCHLDRDLKQTAFILLTQKFPLVVYVITGQRNTFATLKSSNVISLFQCKVVSSSLYVLENQCFERIPIYYQNKLQFVDQVTPLVYYIHSLGLLKHHVNPINLINKFHVTQTAMTHRLTPYPIKAETQ